MEMLKIAWLNYLNTRGRNSKINLILKKELEENIFLKY